MDNLPTPARLGANPAFRHSLSRPWWLVPVFSYLVGFVLFFRFQILSNFDLMFGNRGDARFVVFIHEHVFQWIFGHTALLSPPLFFDQPNTLGYSDAFLLNQLIYAPARIAGLDPFAATNLIPAVLSGASFFATYLLVRSFSAPAAIAAWAAFLFTFSNNMYMKSVHFQHFSTYFIPVICLLFVCGVSRISERPAFARCLAFTAGILLGLLFSTGFYIAWFFGFQIAVASLLFLVVWWLPRWPGARLVPKGFVEVTAYALIGFSIGIIPFLLIYLPMLSTLPLRTFSEYLSHAPTLRDLVNVGQLNLVWGHILSAWSIVAPERLIATEAAIAITPTMLLLTAGAFISTFVPSLWPETLTGGWRRRLAFATAPIPFLIYIVTIRIGPHSLFEYLYEFIPGAAAIRAGYRAMVVANFFSVIAIAIAMSQVYRIDDASSGDRRIRLLGSLLACILIFAGIEQVNLFHPAVLSRRYELAALESVKPPPATCRTFYLADIAAQPPYEVQLNAMLIAQHIRLPTINGYSGLTPPGWRLADTKQSDYERHAIHWALRRSLLRHLCRLDLISSHWTVAQDNKMAACAMVRCLTPNAHGEYLISARDRGNSLFYQDNNWFGSEPWGTWTSGKRATLSFSVGRRRELYATITLRPLLADGRPSQTVQIYANNCEVARHDFQRHEGVTRTLSFTVAPDCLSEDGTVQLVFLSDRAVSPASLGLNDDQRVIGIGVEEISIATPST